MTVKNIICAASGIFNKLNTKYWILAFPNAASNLNQRLRGLYLTPASPATNGEDILTFAYGRNVGSNEGAAVLQVNGKGSIVKSRFIYDPANMMRFKAFSFDSVEGYVLGVYGARVSASTVYGIVKYTTTDSLVFEKIHGIATTGKEAVTLDMAMNGAVTIVCGYDNYATAYNRGFFHIWSSAGGILRYNSISRGANAVFPGGCIYDSVANTWLVRADGNLLFYNSAYTLLGQVTAVGDSLLQGSIVRDTFNNVIVTYSSGDLAAINPTTRALVYRRSTYGQFGYVPSGNGLAVYGTSVSDVRYYYITSLPNSSYEKSFVIWCFNPTSRTIEWGRIFAKASTADDVFNSNDSSIVATNDSLYIKNNYFRGDPIIIRYPRDGSITGTFGEWSITEYGSTADLMILTTAPTSLTYSTAALTTNQLATVTAYTNGDGALPTSDRINIG